MITLGLNLRLSDDLTGMEMTTNILTTSATTGCGQYGEGDPVANTWEYFQIPTDVFQYLVDHYADPPTIGDLYQLGNDALGNALGEGHPGLDDIANAVDMINNGFDECRFGTFNGGFVPPDLQSLPGSEGEIAPSARRSPMKSS